MGNIDCWYLYEIIWGFKDERFLLSLVWESQTETTINLNESMNENKDKY